MSSFSSEILVVDLETTGFTAGVHEVIEIGVIHAEIYKDKVDVKDKFSAMIRPSRFNTIDKTAMSINKISKEELLLARFPHEVRGDFIEWWEDCLGGRKFTPLGHNYSFDKSFLKMFLGESYNQIFDYHNEDTWSFAKALQHANILNRNIDLSLDPLTEYFDINLDAHRAIDDCHATLTLYSKLMELVS